MSQYNWELESLIENTDPSNIMYLMNATVEDKYGVSDEQDSDN